MMHTGARRQPLWPAEPSGHCQPVRHNTKYTQPLTMHSGVIRSRSQACTDVARRLARRKLECGLSASGASNVRSADLKHLRPRSWLTVIDGLCLASLLCACGGDDTSDWTQQPNWGTAPLDTSGAGLAPPTSAALPGGTQAQTNSAYNAADQVVEQVPTTSGSLALWVDNAEVTTTGWIGCEFIDWRTLAIVPSFAAGAFVSIPLIGVVVKEVVAWGLRGFALSDIACDLRFNATLGTKTAVVQADDAVELFNGLSEADLTGQTLSLEVLDCELCDSGGAGDWTTSLGTCSKLITSSDLQSGGFQMDCGSDNVEWLNDQLRSLVGSEQAELFSPVAVRLTFAIRH